MNALKGMIGRHILLNILTKFSGMKIVIFIRHLVFKKSSMLNSLNTLNKKNYSNYSL